MKIELIKAKNNKFDFDGPVKVERLRVAAYCRVSTDDEDQIKSYNSMVKYYTDLIKNNRDWVYVGVYADKAITGTKASVREEFQRMIADCMDGKIDMIIAKSLPRFARNTLDTLKYVRMLKEKNIAVYFEVEKINTLKDGEFLMTILSSVAQQEVENTSAYVKKGLKMKMKRGELVGFSGCLGYDYDPDTKTITVNPEGAEIVRYIFNRYVEGAGTTVIARELNEKLIPTQRGNPWGTTTVMGILTNEKYKGDVLQGKSITVDPISKRRIDNYGEEDMYYITDHHEAIISREIFEKAQEIRIKRGGGRRDLKPGERNKFSRQYAFSCMMKCRYCGSNYSRKVWHSSKVHDKRIWGCYNASKYGKVNCPDSKSIPEVVLENAFLESYRLLADTDQSILDEFLKRATKVIRAESDESKISSLNRRRNYIESRRKLLLDRYLDGKIEQTIYQDTDRKYQKDLEEVEREIFNLRKTSTKQKELNQRINQFKKSLTENNCIIEFDRDVFESLIDHMVIGGFDSEGNKDPYQVTFVYKSGYSDVIKDVVKRLSPPKRKAGRKPKNRQPHDGGNDKNEDSHRAEDTCGDSCSSFQG